MGNEAKCAATYGRKRSNGTAHLETDELVFRGDFRVAIPLANAKAVAKDGRLRIGALVLHLGSQAETWARKINHPKSRLEKLGIKHGLVVSVLDVVDAELTSTPLRPNSDLIFFGANRRDDLRRLATLKKSLKPAGAIWVVRPRGVADITEKDVMAAGKVARLVDVKVVRFSETHTAEKFVIPLASRR